MDLFNIDIECGDFGYSITYLDAEGNILRKAFTQSSKYSFLRELTSTLYPDQCKNPNKLNLKNKKDKPIKKNL